MVQIILEILFGCYWQYILPKQQLNRLFSSFVSDYARVLVFKYNDFSGSAK
jgi:hypothetical protein